MTVKDIVILVGGKGTRISRFSSKIPKPLIKIGSKPFLDQLILKLIKYNFKNIYLLCSYKKKNFFQDIIKKKYITLLLYVLMKELKKELQAHYTN